jgi:uncharacterized Zn-binding protein involved in type VI secretion
MTQPAAVMGDQIVGTCPLHLIPNPATALPQPGPPIPFIAPITVATCPTVLIGGQPAAVVGSSGINTPPHVGLHPLDPFFAPPAQIGIVTMGSTKVTFAGLPAVRMGDPATCCGQPVGTVVAKSPKVMIG